MRVPIEPGSASTPQERAARGHAEYSSTARVLRKRIASGKLSPEKRAKFEDALGIIAPHAEALGRRAKLSAD